MLTVKMNALKVAATELSRRLRAIDASEVRGGLRAQLLNSLAVNENQRGRVERALSSVVAWTAEQAVRLGDLFFFVILVPFSILISRGKGEKNEHTGA